jgi:hypothetical protein
MEDWTPVPRNTSYEMTRDGRVRSVDRIVAAHDRMGRPIQRRMPGKELHPHIEMHGPHGNKRPYRVVAFGRGRKWKICQLLLETFVGPKPSPRHMVLHWDDDSLNDDLANLRWGTASENRYDQYRNAAERRVETGES